MSKNNQSRKRRLPRWAQMLLIALAVCLCATLIGAIAVDNAKWKVRNDENLLTVDETYIKSQKLENGLSVNVDDDGVIKLRGTVDEDWTETVTEVTLVAGTYTLGGMTCDEDSKVALFADVGGVKHYAGSDDKDHGATFTISVQTVVTIQVSVEKDTNLLIAKTIRPTLADGDDEIEFYK